MIYCEIRSNLIEVILSVQTVVWSTFCSTKAFCSTSLAKLVQLEVWTHPQYRIWSVLTHVGCNLRMYTGTEHEFPMQYCS